MCALTHWGLVTPYSDINLGAWRHQTITWTNVDLSSVSSSGIHLRVILQEIPQPSVTEISMKITYLKFCSNLPGANELSPLMHDPYISGNGNKFISLSGSIDLRHYSKIVVIFLLMLKNKSGAWNILEKMIHVDLFCLGSCIGLMLWHRNFFLQWFVKLMGALTFCCSFYNSFFLKVNCGM